MTTKSLPLALLSLVLAGCGSLNRRGDAEVTLTEKQQQAVLERAQPPQQYGFSAFQMDDGIAMNGDARLHPNQTATVDFEKGEVPVIRITGRAARMKINALLDPSSPSSWIEFGKSQELEATFLGMNGQTIPYRGGYNTGRVDAYAAVIKQMRIKNLFIENVPLYIRMAMNSLGPLSRGIKSPKIDAILGYDVLRNFEYFQINLAAGSVTLSATKPYAPKDVLLIGSATIISKPNGGLMVKGAIFGDATPIVLDFAGDFHFARGDVKVLTTKQVSLGDVVYPNVPTLPLPVQNIPPRAGLRMLEQYVVTVCPRAGIVYFERPAM